MHFVHLKPGIPGMMVIAGVNIVMDDLFLCASL